MFKNNDYLKLVNTKGDYRFGYVSNSKERGTILEIDLSDEGLSKINWDEQFSNNVANSGTENFFEIKRNLTNTEKELIPLLAALLTTKLAAARMNVSPITVRAHIRDLKIKLGLETREQLVAYAQGIVRKEGSCSIDGHNGD